MDVSPEELKQAVESQHGVTATLFYVAHVHVEYRPNMMWDGHIHVFDLQGHPKATQAYAWAARAQGTDTPRVYAVLNLDGITGPSDAVRVAIAAETAARPTPEPGL